MYEDLINMADDKRYSIESRIENLRQLPPRGHSLYWLKSLNVIVAVMLALYCYALTTEPSVGVTGWLNHFFPYAGYVLAAWAFISITVLINFASIDDYMPTTYYFVTVFPIVIFGIAALIASLLGAVAFISTASHLSVAGFTIFSIFFYTATISQYAREALEHQGVRLEMLRLKEGFATLKQESGDSNEPVL
jgi:hypothetical protein